MKPTVLLLESIASPAEAWLRNQASVVFADSPNSGLSHVVSESVQAIVTRGKGQVDATLIDACKDLKVIARCGVGLDNVDVAHATKRGIVVVNAPGVNAATVAEHTLSLMLMLQRKMVAATQAVRSDQWVYRTAYDGDELRSKRLGILGLGDIGRRVAKLADAFGMEVCYWSRQPKTSPYLRLELNELVETAHIISIHLPLTSETQGLITLEHLSKTKTQPLLVNTARGGIVADTVILEALKKGYISGFGADLLEASPPPAGYELLSMDNVLVTPHAASLTRTTYEELCMISVENVMALLDGASVDPRFIFNRMQLGIDS